MTFTEFFKRFFAVMVVLLLWAGIWAARSTLLLGFAAAVIAVGISIPAGWLQRLGLHRGLAIAIATIGGGGSAILLALLVLPQLLTELITLLNSIPDAVRSLLDSYENLRNSSTFLRAALPESLFKDAQASTFDPKSAQAFLNQIFDASLAIAPSLLGGINTLAAAVVNLVFVLFIAVFFLIDPQAYLKASLFLLPEHYHQRALEIWQELYRTLKLWILSLSLSISITAGLVWLVLGVLLGMPNAVAVAVFAGLATFVPNIGAFLPLVPIVIFTLANDPTQLVIYVPIYLTIQLLESNVFTPMLIKAELKIPSGALMLFQLLMTLAFGGLGLLLAVPFMAVIIVLVREIYAFDILDLQGVKILAETDDVNVLISAKRLEPMPDLEPVPDADNIADNIVDNIIADNIIVTEPAG